MVNDYQYENLFAEHFAANFIIVDSSASVTINAGIAPTISGEEFLITNTELQNETIKLKVYVVKKTLLSVRWKHQS